MSNMMSKSLDTKGEHVSPLGVGSAAGRIDMGNENLKVKMLIWPDEQQFKMAVYKATLATRGGDVDDATEIDPVVVEDAFKGGLNQCLEWVTTVFEISGVSRGLTHELVRTRKASFAQQSMRHTDMGDPAMRMPAEIAEEYDKPVNDVRHNVGTRGGAWEESIAQSKRAYAALIDADVPYQDARTVLPIATETYIIAEYPLSEFLGTYAYRACHMFYPEIVALFGLMKEALVEKCPWLAEYILIGCEKTAPSNGLEHMCTYQGWERVEGHCPLAWAKEDNRVFKSRKFEN